MCFSIGRGNNLELFKELYEDSGEFICIFFIDYL